MTGRTWNDAQEQRCPDKRGAYDPNTRVIMQGDLTCVMKRIEK
jgi:hypothetical protein